MLGKKINGHSIIVETVSKGRKSLHPITAYQIDSSDYVKYYKTRAIDRSSTSRPEKMGTVDISRPTIAPVNTNIANVEPGVNPGDSTNAATAATAVTDVSVDAEKDASLSVAPQPGADIFQEVSAMAKSEDVKQSQDNIADNIIAMANGTYQPQNAEVDANSETSYTNSRSPQVISVIERLNEGGQDTPTLDEIMAIPENANAEKANEGIETINLPNRESIQQAAYNKAIQKGSFNGKDAAGNERWDGEIWREQRMDIVIGLPGSGKSSVYTNPLSQEHKSRVIDTDDFREYIPEYNGSNAAVVHEEASEIRNVVFKSALKDSENILLSTIGEDAKKLESQIIRFKQLGYKVYLHLNELPNNKSLARAIGRYISKDGKLGRYVSPKLIAAYGNLPSQTYLYLTEQGGTQNGRLDQNLRESRGQNSGDVRSTGSGAESLLAGYDWYNNDVAKGEAPRLIQSSEEIK